jgi:HrpA-like RNA helicase
MLEGDLGIADHLERMGHSPFFLVAATGLGKTVVVPVHVWLRQCEILGRDARRATTWIVEPRVLIAEDQARYMDASLRRLLREAGDGKPPPIFGSITGKGLFNPSAPIKFVTTGVFTAKALAGDFSARTDRIVIDEAHETIAQNADVELGIAVARGQGVHVDFMSATVEVASISRLLHIDPHNVIVAPNKRYPIFAVNAKRSLASCLVDVVEQLLVRKDPFSPYLPPPGHADREQVLRDVFGGPARSHALLVALNSITGPRSDLAVARRLLSDAGLEVDGSAIDVLELSSKQTGSEREMARFNAKRGEIEALKRPYVVLATSVIEMGVTLPALDFVVTMDSGFQAVVVGDRTVPELVPLPFNSLKQRLGRVGRKRAGVGIITREVGAPYSELDFEELNSESIEYEPIRTPLATSRLDSLALYTLKQRWRTPEEVASGIVKLGLASERELLTAERLQDLVVERRVLRALGAEGLNGLSSLGESAEKWIGVGWLPIAFSLERAW